LVEALKWKSNKDLKKEYGGRSGDDFGVSQVCRYDANIVAALQSIIDRCDANLMNSTILAIGFRCWAHDDECLYYQRIQITVVSNNNCDEKSIYVYRFRHSFGSFEDYAEKKTWSKIIYNGKQIIEDEDVSNSSFWRKGLKHENVKLKEQIITPTLLAHFPLDVIGIIFGFGPCSDIIVC
jgi:hypothetical protein